jgi:hypothetical protein
MLAREKLENWSGKIFGGHWIEGRDGEGAIVEPATGDNIGLIGVATAADVDDATGRRPGFPNGTRSSKAHFI